MKTSTSRVAKRYVISARKPTPQSRAFQRDVRDATKFAKQASTAFKRLIPKLKPLAAKAKDEFPGRSKVDLNRRNRVFMKFVKANNEAQKFVDDFIGPPEPEYDSWRNRAYYQMRDVLLKPGYKLAQGAETIAKIAEQAWRVRAIAESQAPLREAIPEVMREFLPKNIVVDVDKGGSIKRITDRFENEYDTLELKIKRQHRVIKDYNKIVKKVKKDLKSQDEETALAALVTSIIMETGIRPGAEGNAAMVTKDGEKVEVETFGAVTLGPKHIKFLKDFAQLEFVGKKGGVNFATLNDREVLRILKMYVDQAKKGGSKVVFVSGDGKRFAYGDLKRYFQNTVLKGLSITDFRKLRATEAVLDSLRKEQRGLYERIMGFADLATEKLAEKIAEEVSGVLNVAYAKAQEALSHDDVKTTIGAYINPQVLFRFLSRGRVEEDLKSAVMTGKNTLKFSPEAFMSAGREALGRTAKEKTLQDLVEDLEEDLE